MTLSSLRPLRAGPLTMYWEPGGLRYITWRGREVIRRVYGAVRDANWGTVPGSLSEIDIRESHEDFAIRFTSSHRQGEIDFLWRGTITGSASGEVRVYFDGEARTTFRRNRIGLCALHPAECAGAATRQARADGTTVESAFPRLIEPQVIGGYSHRDLRMLSHEIVAGAWCDVLFEGEVFETEDQRNWIDASFKTYGTPLALPFPVEIAAGTRVQQSITIRVRAEGDSLIEQETLRDTERIVVALGKDPKGSGQVPDLPQVGVGIPADLPPLKPEERHLLGRVGLAHLRADVNLTSQRWEASAAAALEEAAEMEMPLEIALTLPGHAADDALRSFRHRLRDRGSLVERFIIFRAGEPSTSAEAMRQARRVLGRLGKPIGSGANANFCELNLARHRGKAAIEESDFVCWPITPQVHATDELSIAENASAIAATIETARSFCGDKPLLISPATLKPRFNAVATAAEPPVPPGELPKTVDLRQRALFAAAWTVAAMKPVFEAPIHAATFYETAGWRGVFERGFGSKLPQRFPSRPRELFPVLFPLVDLAGVSWRGRAVPSRSSRPTQVECLTIAWKDALVVFLGNMTDAAQRVAVHGLPDDKAVRLRVLSAENQHLATLSNWHFHEEEFALQTLQPQNLQVEFMLPPHAYARLEATNE